MLMLFTGLVDHTITVCSNVNRSCYQVRNKQNKQQISDRLATLHENLKKVVDHLYTNGIPSRAAANRLHTRFRNTKLREMGIFDSSTAYTLDKGKEIRMCMRDPKTGEPESEQTMTFVALHELAHVMAVEWGHQEEWAKCFKLICEVAVELGIYSPENFSQQPKSYCGTRITSSPLFH